MKALVVEKPGEPLVVTDQSDVQPAAGDAVVRLKTAALNHRDLWIAQGQYPGMKTPVVLGSDGAGIVESVGSGVDPSWAGKEVVINPGLAWGDDPRAQAPSFQILGSPRDGTMAGSIVIPAEQLHAKPAHLNWEEAAALPLAGLTAYRALFAQGRFEAGETVLVSGVGGGVATLALFFAVAAGGDVWVTSSSQEKIEQAKQFGAKGGFLYTSPDWPKEAAEQGVSPALAIDGAGGPGFSLLIDAVRPGGRIVNYGVTAGVTEELNLRKVFWKQLHLIGSTMGSAEQFAQMLEFVSKHQIKPIVDRVFPLDRGNDAFTYLAEASQFGKVVLSIA